MVKRLSSKSIIRSLRAVYVEKRLKRPNASRFGNAEIELLLIYVKPGFCVAWERNTFLNVSQCFSIGWIERGIWSILNVR